MKNKIQKLKFGLIAFAIGMFSLSFTSATIFHLNVEGLGALTQKMLTDNMMYVHFADNGNDFGGFIYFSNKSWDQTGTYEVGTSNASSYECGIKMKGFYYNAERGERLWPLSSGDLSIGGLDMSGGIYTNCAKSGYVTQLKECGKDSSTEDYDSCVNRVKNDFKPDNYGYYGSLNHVYSGKEYHLVVGVNYDTGTQFLSIKKESDLSPTFIRINNRYPVGFIYDYNGGVGLAGCRFDSDVLGRNSMKNLFEEYTKEGGLTQIFILSGDEEPQVVYTGQLSGINCSGFSAENDLVKIIIEGIVGVDENGNLFGGQGNYTDTKMQYFGTKSVTNATLMNYAVKKAESLCRGKWGKSNNNDTIICSEDGSTNPVSLNQIAGKTLIVKNGNVTVKPFTDSNETRNYDIYLLSGNLIIDESGLVNDNGKFVFNTGGFVSSTLVSDFSGNVSRDPDNYISGDVAVGSFIRGNFIVNGNVTGTGGGTNGKLNNKYFIYGKFTTKDTINRLENVFSWSCDNGYGSDGNFCPDSKGNPYKNASLIVIDQNYKSPVLGS